MHVNINSFQNYQNDTTISGSRCLRHFFLLGEEDHPFIDFMNLAERNKKRYKMFVVPITFL